MSMTKNKKEKLKDAICELVNLAEDADISREVFEMLDNAGADIIDCLDELEGYRAIGTVEECRVAVERMKPKKIAYQGEHEKCPNCGSFHVFGKHCTECGQAVAEVKE